MITRLDHTNIVVQNLQCMTRFYSEVLGLRLAKEVRISGDWVEQVVGLKGVEADVVYLEAPDGSRVELIHFDQPTGLRPEGLDRANTQGIRHIAFRVSDIDNVAARIKGAGVKLQSAIQQVPDSQVTYQGGARKRLVYFRDPEANLLELCEYA